MTSCVDLKQDNSRDGDLLYELLGYAMFQPSSGKSRDRLAEYRRDPSLHVLGFDRDGELAGVIVFRLEKIITIVNVGVAESCRKRGLGKAMIDCLRHMHPSIDIEAETDDSAVGFYNQSGFFITSLGEKYPGVQRYRCVF